ncbi:MAG: tRNA dihydrouridine synthase DusB [Nanoarchaeota archaeon]|nr:tRNA dihydrouridine synthase DusB [Nanoarchaeota archaeon]MBU1854117.1 tRNA dihydrouridine synthase DusB [Nanoarchaeota archaeon]
MSSFPKLKNKAILAPMAGVTDVAFRALARDYGAALTYTEFVSSAGIVRGNMETLRMLKVDSSEKPIGVQLFGSSTEEVVKAAILLENKFDVIDINCGCPAYKVIKTGAGSDMLRKPELIGELVGKVVSAVKKPVTVKLRLGTDSKNINALKVARIVEDAGASAITVHGRTARQGYSGNADWDIIRKVKESVNIPVIGNGDVFKPQDFKERLEESGVDYIMIGRAAMTNPYIFRQIIDYLDLGVYEWADKKEIFKAYIKKAENYNIDYQQVKNHALSFTKGLVGGKNLRTELVKCKTIEDVKKFMNKI